MAVLSFLQRTEPPFTPNRLSRSANRLPVHFRPTNFIQLVKGQGPNIVRADNMLQVKDHICKFLSAITRPGIPPSSKHKSPSKLMHEIDGGGYAIPSYSGSDDEFDENKNPGNEIRKMMMK